ncbi:metal-binding protein [Aphanothece hegewaldii CCALA 016]|uniref:Metal-binding protein n=1 Tax=Aphanothece hegewaldii CCALA 016 TaxID=2107694 RepID=A0A2T1M277_9CHRO|nr:CHAD domain-containing protein [Aphanothece hegewaldii]PSF38798.1 metal-binding protein [Aphanothece hegewaldii CCALA 016]
MTELMIQDAKTLADWSYIAISKHFKKILKHEAEVIQDKDPEELHQMRVGMRRLRSACTGFSYALNLPKAANEKNVGKVARILGELRDIDVLEEALKQQYQPVLPKPEQKALNTALKILSDKRDKTFLKVKKILQGDLYSNLKEAFQEWLDKPIYQDLGYLAIQTVLPDLLLPQVSHFLLHPAWLIGNNSIELHKNWTPEEVENLLHKQGYIVHNLRKEAKRTRYNMELFTEFYGESYQNYLQDVKTIQSILGEIQDCFVLADFLTDVFGKNLEDGIPTLLNKLQEIRYEKWNEWQDLRGKFLNPETRQEFHLTILASESKKLVETNGLTHV